MAETTSTTDKKEHTSGLFEPEAAKVVRRESLVPNLQLLTVHAPAVAAKIQPGQFVIVRADEHGERIPLTVADWDREAGLVSCVFMQVGTSTYKLGQLKPGDVVPTFAGPLGKPLEIETWGTVLCAGGCYGIGSIYPVARALKEKGNRVISFIEGRSKFLLYWLDRLAAVSDEVLIATRDGSLGEKEGYPNMVDRMLAAGETVDRVIALGCTFMMYQMSETTRPFEVKTIVSLNPIMIDGTGMCGACRIVVGGKTRFACVDGPDFDGHEVDWELLLSRRKAYLGPETESAER
ncbi:MAG: sulfide/dihydroorotate dehydrogenase-like FAD/NAD-binding protein [Anaerolineae bacterium]|nr:sulfide/dihydroorotate dehydrogenase-like FAD/NAD-binding protein [Anaerolineae bacterium]